MANTTRELRTLTGVAPAAAQRAAERAVARHSWRTLGIYWLVAFVAWLIVTVLAWHAERSLGKASIVTGYALFAVMVTLGFLKMRKRLLVLPLGTVREWRRRGART